MPFLLRPLCVLQRGALAAGKCRATGPPRATCAPCSPERPRGFACAASSFRAGRPGIRGGVPWGHRLGAGLLGLAWVLVGGAQADTCSAAGDGAMQTSGGGEEGSDDDGNVPASAFHVLHIAGDGNCLFRAAAQGHALRSEGYALTDVDETGQAAVLRAGAVAELRARRAETEWFIEGNFDQYCKRMEVAGSWGGEPEILMLTHHLKAPITVYMAQGKGRVRAIGEYGQEYIAAERKEGGEGEGEGEGLVKGSSAPPVRLMFHGAGHYECLVFKADQQLRSRL